MNQENDKKNMIVVLDGCISGCRNFNTDRLNAAWKKIMKITKQDDWKNKRR